jgi:RNA polymerase sigma-70 factor (ECF subfamily)
MFCRCFLNKHDKSRVADEEKALMRRIVNGDEGAFEALYDRYSRLLYSILLSVVKHPPEAQDMLQELFMHIWHQAKQFNAERGSVYSWLVTMTRNRAIDRLRSKSYRDRQQEFANDAAMMLVPDDEISPLDGITISEDRERVQNALAQIPIEQRDALMLAYFQGYTQTEIAELLQIPLGTIKTRMRQGLIKLSSLLQGVAP